MSLFWSKTAFISKKFNSQLTPENVIDLCLSVVMTFALPFSLLSEKTQFQNINPPFVWFLFITWSPILRPISVSCQSREGNWTFSGIKKVSSRFYLSLRTSANVCQDAVQLTKCIPEFWELLRLPDRVFKAKNEKF